jgi:hypothetical protein
MKEYKLNKWLRASGLCQLLWMPHTRKVVVLIGKKEMKEEIREIMKLKINVDERLSSDITWVQKNQRPLVCGQLKFKPMPRHSF